MMHDELAHKAHARYVDWRKSECGKDVSAFAHDAVNRVIESNFKDLESVRPTNMHTVLGLTGSMLPLPIGNILRDLATFFYENPEVATEAWKSIKDSIDPMNKQGWLG